MKALFVEWIGIKSILKIQSELDSNYWVFFTHQIEKKGFYFNNISNNIYLIFEININEKLRILSKLLLKVA